MEESLDIIKRLKLHETDEILLRIAKNVVARYLNRPAHECW